MKPFEKLMNVLSKNLGYTVVLVAAIILFAIFSDGLISALLAYTCIVALVREYNKTPAKVAPKSKPRTKKK